MTNNKRYELLLLILTLLGIGLGVGAGAFLVLRKGESAFLIVTALLTVLALLAALIYVLKGAKKKAAVYFKTFMLCYALAEFSSILSASGLAVNQPAAVAVNAAIFMLLILLAVGTDLGRTKSFLICGAIVVLALGMLVGAVVLYPGVLRGGTALGTVFALRAGANLVLSLLTGAMVAAKYADKARRGRT